MYGFFECDTVWSGRIIYESIKERGGSRPLSSPIRVRIFLRVKGSGSFGEEKVRIIHDRDWTLATTIRREYQ
jgi:hypothetical protein